MSPSKTPKPARKGQVKKTDAAQAERFKKMAKELDGDERPDRYDRDFKGVTGQANKPRK